jgi:hypothetical protein
MADPKKFYAYDDMKAFDARMATEARKMSDLVAAFRKVNDQIVADRKVHCQDFPKSLMAYVAANLVHTKGYTMILQKFNKSLGNLDAAYDKCL